MSSYEKKGWKCSSRLKTQVNRKKLFSSESRCWGSMKNSRSCLHRDEMWHGRPAHDCFFTRARCPCHRGFIPKQTRAKSPTPPSFFKTRPSTNRRSLHCWEVRGAKEITDQGTKRFRLFATIGRKLRQNRCRRRSRSVSPRRRRSKRLIYSMSKLFWFMLVWRRKWHGRLAHGWGLAIFRERRRPRRHLSCPPMSYKI